MNNNLKLISKLQQASDYSSLLLSEVYEDYTLFHIMSLIDEESLNQKKLARKMGMTEPALSMKLRNLEKQGLFIKKKSNEDKRNFILVLTEKGKEVLDHHKNLLNMRATELFADFSESELEMLNQLIEKMNAHGFK